MKFWYILPVFLVFLTSCASVNVKLDYDTRTDFTKYKTYTINPEMQSGLSELDQRRVVRLIDSVMQARGFERKLVADFLIDLRSQVYQRPANPNVGIGMGGTNGNVGGGFSIGVPTGGGLKRQIDIAFFDFTTDRIFWEAQTEKSFQMNSTPGKREEVLRQVVIKALDRYPPPIK